jgi:hypothetical protein
MRAPVAAMLLAATLAACSSVSATLPYKPEVQPAGAFVSAAYTVVGDRLRVEIDTGGRRLERAQIVKPYGVVVEAQTVEYTTPGGVGGGPVGIGLGIGGFGGLGGGVRTGVGVSTGTTVGGGGPTSVTTIASFPLAEAGPRPWRVRVRLAGLDPVDILVGEAEAAPGPAPR